MRNAWEVARGFVLMFFRDRVNVFFTLVFNVFLLVLLGGTVEDRFNVQVPVALADAAHTPAGRAVVTRLRREPNLTVTVLAADSTVRRAVADGHYAAGVLLDDTGGQVRVRLLSDPTREMWARLLRPAVEAAVLASRLGTEGTDPAGQARVEIEPVRGRHLRYFDFLFPGVLAFTIMQIAFAGGLTLLQHRTSEALKRLKITPLTRGEFLLGYALSQGAIVAVQLLLFWVVAAVAFGYRASGSLPQLAAVTALGAAEFVCLGLILGNLAPSTEAGANLVRFLTFPAAFLCGVFVPAEALPRYLAIGAAAYPLTPFAGAMRATANYGAPPGAITTQLLAMAVVLVVAATLAVRTFRWEEQAS
jgi:ABC-2 type transport system permease protein